VKAALGLSAVVLLAGTSAPTQSPPPPPAVFGSRLDLVFVTVTVRGPDGRAVPDLPVSSFEVREDGKPRPIEVFSRAGDAEDHDRLALDVALLLDTSGSMSAELESAQRAALAVLQRIPKLRRRTVVSFDTDIRFWRAEADPVALLPEVLAARPPNGASAIRSALVAGLDALAREGSGRGALILLSDGVDFGSPVTETQLLRAIDAANVAIYPIPFVASGWASGPGSFRRDPITRGPVGFPTAPDTLVARAFLERIAEASGGLVLLPHGGSLAPTLDRLVEELSSQYVIGFAPAAATPGRSHRLEVRVADRRLKVRHRARYLAR
jgi:VWFA-related protein